MGRRKSKRKAVVRKGPPPLDTEFTCPLCNEEKAVFCRLDHKLKQGEIECRKCHKKHAFPINALTEPVDLYGEWIDLLTEKHNQFEAERAARDGADVVDRTPSITGAGAGGAAREAAATSAGGSNTNKRPVSFASVADDDDDEDQEEDLDDEDD